MKIKCPFCNQEVTVTPGDNLRKHYKDNRYRCAGSGFPVILIAGLDKEEIAAIGE